MIEYPAFVFKQAKNSPIQVTFVAPSHEIDSWAKVPTRLSNKKTGFQRAALPSHVKDIKKFFRDDDSKENSSPTAILIGVEPNAQALLKIFDSEGNEIVPASISQTPVLCKLVVNYEQWDPSEYDGQPDKEIAALAEHLGFLNQQVPDSENPEDSVAESDEHVTDATGDEDTLDTQLEADDPEDGELGQTEREIEDFFAGLRPEALRQILIDEDYVAWSLQKKSRLLEILKDEPKPCLIIDGQHRVKGTRDIGNIPFCVSLLPFANWAELSFQFIVNNSSAKKVDENLLFGIVGQSLTPDQLAKTEGRLNRAGIKVSLIKAAMRVQLESNPFAGMLRTNTPGEKGFLDATAFQKKVIELWYGGRSKNGLESKFKQFKATEKRAARSIGEIFGPLCQGSNNRDRAEYWQAQLWFEYFKAFWEPIARQYSAQLWPQSEADWLPTDQAKLAKDSQAKTRQKLMRATVLGLLQIAVLQAWADHTFNSLERDDKTWADLKLTPAKFSTQIEKIIKRLPEEFFSTLTYTGFDASKPLREEVLQCMLDLLDNHKKLPEVKDEHKRFWA
jgi:hypothetical protein